MPALPARLDRIARNRLMRRSTLLGGGAAAGLCAVAVGQVLGPDFVGHHALIDLGEIPGVPAAYGGLAFLPGDLSTLLIAGASRSGAGAIHALCVERDAQGGVIGLSAREPEWLASTPFIDGGIDFAPDGTLLFTSYPNHVLGQVLPGSVGPDFIVHLTDVGMAPSTGAVRVVPPGHAGAGRTKFVTLSTSRWYDALLTPLGGGQWSVSVGGFVHIPGGPDGIAFVPPGSPAFDGASVLVPMSGAGKVVAFELDSNGDPIAASARDFLLQVTGAAGAAIDPVTGDFFCSASGAGGHRVLRVSGFVPPPCTADLDRSGSIDGGDLGTLLGEWNSTSGSAADLNGDGLVDGEDLGTLLGQWGPCPN